MKRNIEYDLSQIVNDRVYYNVHIYGDYTEEEDNEAYREFLDFFYEMFDGDETEYSFYESCCSPIIYD